MTTATRVLYLSYDGLTDPLGQSQVLPYIAGLSAEGYRFYLVSFEKKEKFKKLEGEIRALCHHHSIEWIPLTYHKKPPVLSTLFDIWKLWQHVKKIHTQKEINIVHCRSYITSIVGLRAKSKWGVKFIFDMRGFWADERVEGGLWNLNNPLYKLIFRFFKGKEKLFLVEADHVISLTHNAMNEIESWRIKNAPITVIPTCVDLELFDPKKITKADQDQLRLKIGISENDFVLIYLGSWGTWYLTDEMLDFFTALRKEKTNAKFLILSPDAVNLKNYPFKNDVIVTSAPRQQMPLYISLATASVCFIKATFSKKASSATKMGEIMAMGVQLIANSGWGDVASIFSDHNRDHLTDLSIESYRRIASAVVAGTLSAMSRKRDDYSLSSGILSYSKVYSTVLGK